MAPSALSGNALALALEPEGLLPKECLDVELLMPVDGALTLRYSVLVTQDDLPKLIRAFERLRVQP